MLAPPRLTPDLTTLGQLDAPIFKKASPMLHRKVPPNQDVKTIFILGAGASRSAGGPLMFDFIENANMIHRRGESGWASNSFEHVLDARKKLQIAFAKSSIDLDNIENLFTTFEMASLVGRLGGLSADKVESLPGALRYLIMRTIEQTILYPIRSDAYHIAPPHPYDAFAELLVELNTMREAGPIAVISFNYDLCLEYALLQQKAIPDYGLSAAPSNRNGIRIYKVHGSLNWSRDQDSGEIKAMPVKELATKPYWDRMGLNHDAERPIDTMELIVGPDAWGERILPEPVIVPPTWNKGIYQDMLRPVWRHASAALSTADNIFVIGYSLPPSDQFFRSFYSLSTISDSIIERFWLFDPSPLPEISDRFRRLLGPAVTERGKFQHAQVKFSGAIAQIGEAFKLKFHPIKDR
jgi:hypothetical protein